MPFRSIENAVADPYNQKNYRLYNMHLATVCTVYFTMHIYFTFLLFPETRATNGVRIQPTEFQSDILLPIHKQE